MKSADMFKLGVVNMVNLEAAYMIWRLVRAD